MQQRFRLFRRNSGVFYIQDRATGVQESLQTKTKVEAVRLLNARNEAHHQPESSRRIAQAYLIATDPESRTRTWQQVFEAAAKNKPAESTAHRWETALKDKAFNSLRRLPLVETRPEHFLKVLEAGTVIANLEAEDFDRKERLLTFHRLKSRQKSQLRYGKKLEEILETLPPSGPLFPYLRTVRECDRATEFKQRCTGLSISDVTLHSYRYSWAQRAAACGYPQRLAQAALGHSSKAVHAHYANKAEVKFPSLEEWTRSLGPNIIAVNFPKPENSAPNIQGAQETSAAG